MGQEVNKFESAAVDPQAVARMEALLRQRVNTSFTPQSQRALKLHYVPEHAALKIGCLEVPCWLQLSPDASVWGFGCPWWHTVLREDHEFEARVFIEVAKVNARIEALKGRSETGKAN